MSQKDPSEMDMAAVEALIAQLATGVRDERGWLRYAGGDPHERRRAIRALARLGRPVVERLVGCLDLDLGVGAGAAEALGLIGDDRAVEPLIAALANEEDADVRQAAATALGRLGNREATEWLLAALLDEDEDVRWAVANALGEVGYPDGLEALEALVRRSPEEVFSVGDEETPEVELIPVLRRFEDRPEALWDTSDELAILASYALGRICEPQSLPCLMHALRTDRDANVRWHAAEALGSIGLPDALPELERAALEEHVVSDQGPLSAAAQEAIAKIKASRHPKPHPIPERPQPPVLYKYFCPRLVCVLENQSLRFTPASSFNDPFELFTSLDAFIRPLVTALLTERYKALLHSRMHAVMDEYLGDFAYDLGLSTTISEKLRDDDSEEVRAIRQTVEYAFRSAHKNSKERLEMATKVRGVLDRQFGVLCLTEKPDDILMWSHYADHHRGFVIEFDATTPFFDHRRHQYDPIGRTQPVQYHEAHPPRGLFDPKYWFRSRKSAPRDLLEYSASLCLLTKSREWSHELEWRMIRSLEEADRIDRCKDEDIHLFEFPPEIIRAVVMGCRMTPADCERLRQAVARPEYSHVILRKAEMHARQFRLLIKEDDSFVERRFLADLAAFPYDGIQQRLDRTKIGGRRFYAAMSSLEAKGWISAPPHDRSAGGKRILKLTKAGRAYLSQWTD